MDQMALTPAEWAETVRALVIVGVAVVVAWLLPATVAGIVRAMAGRGAGDLVARALCGPVGVLIVLQAFFVTLSRLSYLDGQGHIVQRAWLATTILVLVYGAQRLVVPLTQWYADRSATGRTRLHSLPPLQRAIRALTWIIGLLVVLATLDIEISPLLAGLGLSGLAVALALQPLLANIFASSYLLSDQSIRIGDAIRVEAGGPSGVVEDIGWRATRIRTGDHNLAIIPNSVLAQSTMTNFDAHARDTDVTVTLHVGVDADLALVERACRDELALLRDEATDLVVSSAMPSFQYQSSAEGKIAFVAGLRARSWHESAEVRHRIIMRLHGRLQAEGVALA